MIYGKINVEKIDKAKLFKGRKGTYLDIVLLETRDDRFGNDWVILQSVSQEDRKAGVKGAIIGNAKNRDSERRAEKPDFAAEGAVGEGSAVPF